MVPLVFYAIHPCNANALKFNYRYSTFNKISDIGNIWDSHSDESPLKYPRKMQNERLAATVHINKYEEPRINSDSPHNLAWVFPRLADQTQGM